MVVKPLTLKLKESIKLWQLSEELSIPIFVEFHKRFDRQQICQRLFSKWSGEAIFIHIRNIPREKKYPWKSRIGLKEVIFFLI